MSTENSNETLIEEKIKDIDKKIEKIFEQTSPVLNQEVTIIFPTL